MYKNQSVTTHNGINFYIHFWGYGRSLHQIFYFLLFLLLYPEVPLGLDIIFKKGHKHAKARNFSAVMDPKWATQCEIHTPSVEEFGIPTKTIVLVIPDPDNFPENLCSRSRQNTWEKGRTEHLEWHCSWNWIGQRSDRFHGINWNGTRY